MPCLEPKTTMTLSMFCETQSNVYCLSIFRTDKILNRASPIVFLRYDFILLRQLNERSEEQDVAGIDARIFATAENKGSFSILSFHL